MDDDDPIDVSGRCFELVSCEVPQGRNWGRSMLTFTKQDNLNHLSIVVETLGDTFKESWSCAVDKVSCTLSQGFFRDSYVSVTVSNRHPSTSFQSSDRACFRLAFPCVLKFANVLEAAGGDVHFPSGFVRDKFVPVPASVRVAVPVPVTSASDDHLSAVGNANIVATTTTAVEREQTSSKSLEDTSTRYPVVSPECGHSICVKCAKMRKSGICVTCGSRSYQYLHVYGSYLRESLCSSLWKKNVDLCAIIEQNARDVVDYMECSSCKSKEKRERMKICVTCAEEWNKEWKGMKEEEIRLFIICAFCSTEAQHSGHSLVNYLPWKLNEHLTTTVTNHQSTVSGMDELNHYEMERGKECVEIWKKEMDSCREPGVMELETYRAGLLIVDVLNKECEMVTRASEECLPPLRKYSKIVEDSTSRIQQLKKDVKEKKDLSGRISEDWEEGE